MALTAIQQAAADILRPYRSEYSYVAGGAVPDGAGLSRLKKADGAVGRMQIAMRLRSGHWPSYILLTLRTKPSVCFRACNRTQSGENNRC